MHNSTIFRIAPCILAIATLAFGQTASPEAKGPPPKYDPVSVARGKETFVGACGFCHGSNAKGGEKGPDLLRSVIVLDDEHGKAIGPVILRGRPDKGMPRFPYSPLQILDISNFLHDAIGNAASLQANDFRAQTFCESQIRGKGTRIGFFRANFPFHMNDV